METNELKPPTGQLDKVASIGTVRDGKLVGEYDFYEYLAKLEGKRVRWSLEEVNK